MNALPEEATAGGIEKGMGRLLLVDDDPFAANLLGLLFKEHGNDVMEVSSGEACLSVMVDFAPQVVLLDIEMPGGIDGYETCRQIRSRFDRANLTIIFLSGHDTLEDRLRAYDAGGDDFVAKPFVAEELRRKIAIAIGARIHRRSLVDDKIQAEESANVLLQGYDEMGSVLKFVRGALGSRSLTALAELTISSMRITKVRCMVQLRGSAAGGTLTMTQNGLASPLEESVFEHMRAHGRIFQFKTRMIVNYDSVSVLVVDMPAEDEALAGRIRDYAAIIAEAAEDAVANISLRADAVERAKDLRNLAEDGHAGIEQLQSTYRVHQTDTRFELERMVEKIESMYYRFGLSESQEAEISESARFSKDGVLKLFDRYGADFDKQFTIILDGLNRASTYQIDMEEGSAQASEVWV
jgi:DNA-binding response OmpR family regulator